MKITEFIERLNEYPVDTEVVDVLWTDEDVKMQASDMGMELTKEEMGKACGLLSKYHDAEYGINWDNISFIINEVKNTSM